jgi:hypothetical protein
MNKVKLDRPTPELVDAAREKFDKEDEAVEQGLKELFAQFPSNTKLAHVLIKVAALNTLYSTNIFAVRKVALAICAKGQEIDDMIAKAIPEVVEMVARVNVGAEQKGRYNYSFATKYCSWHNSEQYPIWDSRVDRYLYHLQKQDSFAPAFKKHDYIWTYSNFREVVIAFRRHFGLEQFSFKELDKFMYEYGGPLPAPTTPDDPSSLPQ